jgi:hypothetical protein
LFLWREFDGAILIGLRGIGCDVDHARQAPLLPANTFA